MRKIAVLASGGDAPGMNAAIRAVVRTALHAGAEIWGAWDGYGGLLEHRFQQLTSRGVSGILQRGGSIIGSGRSERFLDPAVRESCVHQLQSMGFEGLIAIGGDGTLQGATELSKLGFPTVTIPGTIDNDMPGTEIAIGADTAINTAVDAIDALRDTASAHRRAMIVEVMGRHSGYIAVQAGIATGAELILTPERPITLDAIYDELETTLRRGKRHFIIVLAEGAEWPAAELAQLINDAPNAYAARYTVLGYIQRGGVPSRFDRILATRMGVAATEALLGGHSDALVAWRHNRCEVLPVATLDPQHDPWDEQLDHVHRITAT